MASITLLSYLSPIANPKIFWPISVIAVFYPWLLLSNVLFVIFWMFYKLRFASISIITILIGYNFFNEFIGFSSAGFQSNPNQLEILSFNTQNLNYIFKSEEGRTNRSNQFFSFLNEYKDVDVICAQEIGTRSLELWHKKMKFPNQFAPEKVGPVIFSKHPIINKGQIHSSTSTINSCLWVDINVRGTTIRIYNLHMQSNKITMTAAKVIDDANPQNKETWNGVKSIIERYKQNATYRIEHAERIRAHMLDCPYPIVLAGDFNDVPQSFLYHILAKDLKDSFNQQGSGLGITFAGKIPALRIDYILVDKKFEIQNHEILHNNFSDHYAIKSIITLKEQQ